MVTLHKTYDIITKRTSQTLFLKHPKTTMEYRIDSMTHKVRRGADSYG